MAIAVADRLRCRRKKFCKTFRRLRARCADKHPADSGRPALRKLRFYFAYIVYRAVPYSNRRRLLILLSVEVFYT